MALSMHLMELVQGAVRVLLASSIVQCCEAVDEKLAKWRKGLVAAEEPDDVTPARSPKRI